MCFEKCTVQNVWLFLKDDGIKEKQIGLKKEIDGLLLETGRTSFCLFTDGQLWCFYIKIVWSILLNGPDDWFFCACKEFFMDLVSILFPYNLRYMFSPFLWASSTGCFDNAADRLCRNRNEWQPCSTDLVANRCQR